MWKLPDAPELQAEIHEALSYDFLSLYNVWRIAKLIHAGGVDWDTLTERGRATRQVNLFAVVNARQLQADLHGSPRADLHSTTVTLLHMYMFSSGASSAWKWMLDLCDAWAEVSGQSLEHLPAQQPPEKTSYPTDSEDHLPQGAKQPTAIAKPSKRDPNGYFPRLRKFIRVQDPLGTFKKNGKRQSIHNIARIVRERWDSRKDLTGGGELTAASSTIRKALKDIFEEIDAEPKKAPTVR